MLLRGPFNYLNRQIVDPDNLNIGSLTLSLLSPLIELLQCFMWAWISGNAPHYKNLKNLLMAHYILTAELGRGANMEGADRPQLNVNTS